MPRKSTVKKLEAELAVVKEAMVVFPERRHELDIYCALLSGRIGRTKRAARLRRAKALQHTYAQRADIERDYKRAKMKR